MPNSTALNSTAKLTAAMLVLAAFCCVTTSTARAQATSPQSSSPRGAAELIGRISGNEMTLGGVADFVTTNGRSSGMLASGSEVTLRFGQARIELLDGGEIILCAPAHLTLLKAGSAITLALDYGRVHAQVDPAVTLTVYTPLIVATAVPIGQGASDVTIGLDQQGEICALAESGAARMSQQFSGQSLLVPQGGELSMTGGQLSASRMGVEGCHCELPVAPSNGPGRFAFVAPIHPIVPASGSSPLRARPVEPPGGLLQGEAAMRVQMPPLTFDSSSPTPPPDPDPATLLLVRETRVQSDVVFAGRIEGPITAVAIPAKMEMPAPVAAVSKERKPGIFARLFGIFRRRKPATPCAGAGCTQGN